MKTSHRIFSTVGGLLVAGTFLCAVTGCSEAESANAAEAISGPADAASFEQYWFHQGAEISRFRLVQSRYGDQHEGDLTLVYVTEPFNPETQVKADNPNATNPAPVPVLKLNAMRAFNTGLYRYNIMKSVFAPTDLDMHPWPLKVTHSVQDWCGQTFAQLNRLDEGYHLRSFSYFQSDGDVDAEMPEAMPEDAIWTLIRLDPERLPTGDFSLIRGPLQARVAHVPTQVVNAEASLGVNERGQPGGEGNLRYTVRVPAEGRTLAWVFQPNFPWRLEYFSEERRGLPKTEAFRQETIFSWYWNENRPAQESKRQEALGFAY
ncbi:MAG: hypothetical protein ACFB20_00855 [Opitutales bacterium]